MKSYKELTTILRSRMKDIKTIVVGFLLMLVLAVLHPSNPAYEGINPNPYLVISIILAAFLGLRNTFIVSPIIAISYMTALWLKTDLLAVESFFSFNNFIMPGAIIIIPTMISVITDGLREKLSEQEKEGQKKKFCN